jgi:hypothetical protein
MGGRSPARAERELGVWKAQVRRPDVAVVLGGQAHRQSAVIDRTDAMQL